MAEIPEVFNQAGAAFVLLRDGQKFPPIEKEWQKKAHSYQEAVAHKGNVGIAAGAGYIGLDQDNPTAFEGLSLPSTTTWETRPGRYGMRFEVADDVAAALAAVGKKADQAQLKLFKDGMPCGEVKISRTYQVIPPSWKKLDDGSRADYKMLDSSPPALINLSDLLEGLQAIGLTFSSKLEANVTKLESMATEARQRRIETDPDRRRRYAEAALQDEVRTLAGTPEGGRNVQLNDSAFALGQFVGAGDLDEGEVIIALSEAAEFTGLDSEGIRKTILSGLTAGRQKPRKIPKREEPKGPTVLTALQTLLDNEDMIKGECIWEWRSNKRRIESVLKDGYLNPKGEEKAHKFLKKFHKALKELGIDYNDLYPLLLKPKSNKEEFSEEIKAKALDVLKNGDPVKFIVDSCSETVEGAETAIKKLLCCISVQNIKQSSGLHPKLNGDSSGGKTFTVYTFAHHMPKEAVIKGSMSAKAGFYHKDGNRVFRILDDYQAGNEDLDTVIKQTSSEFHAPYQHRTVANHMAMLMEIGAEQTWAITSVDSSQEIQVLNRQLPININDSKDLTQKVNKKTIERYSNGKIQFPLSETVLVSRCIIQTLRDEGYIDIRIPFGDRINWLDDSNRRNPGLFMDLMVAFTAIYRHQREKDSEGYYLASEADFNAAKALFSDKDAEELVKRLTKKERETLDFMLSRPEGITQDDLAEHLKVSRQRAGQIIYGQKKDSGGGLMGKLAINETRLSEMIKINDTEKRTVHKTVYSLKEYNRLAGFDAIVKLEPEAVEPCKPCKDGAIDPAREDTASSKDGAIVESKKEKEKEERDIEDLQGSSLDASLSLSEKAKNPCKPCTVATDIDASPCTVLAETLQPLHDLDFSPTETALLRRICGRMQKEGKQLDPFVLAYAMRSNDCDIGIQRCKAWIAAEAT